MLLMQLVELVPEEGQEEPRLMAVARSEDINLLRCLLQAEKTEPYEDDINGQSVTKIFRKGGPFENFREPEDSTHLFVEIGSREEQLRDLINEITTRVNSEWDAIEAETVSCNNDIELLDILMRRQSQNKQGTENND